MSDGEIQQPAPPNSWQFKPEDEERAQTVVPTATAIPPAGPEGSISWTASEFIAHQKSAGWYAALAGGAVVLAAIVWLLTKDEISAAVVIVAAVFFGVYAARKPRQLLYSLDSSGLTIGNRYVSYQQFRSFSVVPEGAFNSIVFMPLRRFAPLTTIYYDPADEIKIVALLSDRLPLEQRQKDFIDRLMWRIRF